MKLYTRQELKILKYKFIAKDGMSVKQAEERIKHLIEWTESQHKKKKKESYISPEEQQKIKIKAGIHELRGI